MANGFKDVRTAAQRTNAPGAPQAKQYVTNFGGSRTRGLLGAVLGMISKIASKVNPRNSASPLGVQITENVTQPTFPFVTDQPTTSALARGKSHPSVIEKLSNLVTSVKQGRAQIGTSNQFVNRAAAAASQLFHPISQRLFTDQSKNNSWSEPQTPYKAKYPYNHVTESESGHLIEVDDTPGAERIHIWHRSGTFLELHPDGTSVYKTVKDGYMITLADHHVSVQGNCHVSVEGTITLFCKGDVSAEVRGNLSASAEGNIGLQGENIELVANKKIKLNAPTVDLNYVTLPTSFKPVKSFPSGRPVLAPITKKLRVSAPPGFTPEEGEEPTVEGMNDYLPTEDVGTVPLGDPSKYMQATPTAIAARTISFDHPSEVNQALDKYQAHQDLSLQLGDYTTANTKLVSGEQHGPFAYTLRDRDWDELTPTITFTEASVFSNSTVIATGWTLDKFTTNTAIPSGALVTQVGMSDFDIATHLNVLVTYLWIPLVKQYPALEILRAFDTVNSGQSDHERGYAMDVRIPGTSADAYVAICQWIAANLPFDQMILNFTNIGDGETWIHLSLQQHQQRQQVLTKDWRDEFHEGLYTFTEYERGEDHVTAIEQALVEQANTESWLSTYEDVNATRSQEESTNGYTSLWDGLTSIFAEQIAILKADNELTLWADMANGSTAFVELVVVTLRAQGYNVARNGTMVNQIVLPNPSGVADQNAIQTGLELYSFAESEDEPGIAMTDETSAYLDASLVAMWTLP